MKALKIIGIVVGGLAVLGAIVLIAVGVLVHQVIDLDTQNLKRDDYLGPYAGTATATMATQYSQHGYTVRYTDARSRTVTSQAIGQGSPYPKAGDQVSVFVRASDRSDILVTAQPALEALSGHLKLGGYLAGGAGVVLIIGCSVLLATGRRKRLARAGRSGPGGGPPQQPRPPQFQQQPYPPQSPGQQAFPPPQYPPGPQQQYPQQQYPQQPPYPQQPGQQPPYPPQPPQPPRP